MTLPTLRDIALLLTDAADAVRDHEPEIAAVLDARAAARMERYRVVLCCAEVAHLATARAAAHRSEPVLAAWGDLSAEVRDTAAATAERALCGNVDGTPHLVAAITRAMGVELGWQSTAPTTPTDDNATPEIA